MKLSLKRWKVLAGAVALAAGVAAPIALQAGPAAAADDSFVISDYTGNQQGWDGYGQLDDLGSGSTEMNLVYEGTVQSTGGQCWPFACGNGANAYFQGKNVWIMYIHNSADCVYDAAGNYALFGTGCGTSHPSTLLVQANPWDGHSGSESWASVSGTNNNGGTGVYLETLGSLDGDIFTASASATKVSYHTVVG